MFSSETVANVFGTNYKKANDFVYWLINSPCALAGCKHDCSLSTGHQRDSQTIREIHVHKHLQVSNAISDKLIIKICDSQWEKVPF